MIRISSKGNRAEARVTSSRGNRAHIESIPTLAKPRDLAPHTLERFIFRASTHLPRSPQGPIGMQHSTLHHKQPRLALSWERTICETRRTERLVKHESPTHTFRSSSPSCAEFIAKMSRSTQLRPKNNGLDRLVTEKIAHSRRINPTHRQNCLKGRKHNMRKTAKTEITRQKKKKLPQPKIFTVSCKHRHVTCIGETTVPGGEMVSQAPGLPSIAPHLRLVSRPRPIPPPPP